MYKLVAPLIAIAAVVAACGGGGGGSGDTATKDVNNPASLKGQTIEYWASNQAPTIQDDQKILKDEAAKFTQQTGVKVNIKVIGWPDLFNNITTATTSGRSRGSGVQILASTVQAVSSTSPIGAESGNRSMAAVISVSVSRMYSRSTSSLVG